MREQLHPTPPSSRAPPMRRRGERPGHSATTAHFQAAYPFLGMGGLGAPGVYVGTDAFGGAWAFDPLGNSFRWWSRSCSFQSKS